MQSPFSRSVLRVTFLYMCLAGLWAAFSNRLLTRLAPDAESLTQLEALNDWIFVAATALGLLGLLWTRRQAEAERDQAAEALRASENRFRALIENSADAITLLNADGTVAHDTPAAPGLLGYGPDELLGHNAFDLLHPDDRPGIQTLFAQLAQDPRAKISAQFRLRHKNGAWRWLEGVATNLLAEPSVGAIVVNYRDVTERRLVEDAYRTLVEKSLQGNVVFQDGRVVFANPATERFTGYTPAELLALTPEQIPALIAPEDRALVFGHLQDRLAGRPTPAQYRFRSVHKDGSVRWLEVLSQLIEYHGRPAIHTAILDVTERVEAEAALQASEEKYRVVLENIGEVVYAVKLPPGQWAGGEIEFVSPQTNKIVGYTANEFLRDSGLWASLIHPEDTAAVEAQTRNILDSRQDGIREYRVRHRHTGEYRWVEDHVMPQLDESGQVRGLFGVARDVTERKQMEDILRDLAAGLAVTNGAEALHALVQRLARLLNVEHVFVGELLAGAPDEIRTLAFWSRGARVENIDYLLAGTPCENIVGQQLRVIPRGVQEQYPRAPKLAELSVEGFMGSPLWDAAGRPLGVLAAMSEKPLEQSARAEAVFRIFANRAGSELERMRAESALLTSEAKFRGLLESAPDAILFVNPAGRITFCNFNGEKMFGANRTELLGRPIEDLIPERFHARHIAHRQHYTGAPKGRQMGSRLELLARRRDGSEFPVDIMLTPVELNGELTVMAMARDISERKQRELELEALAQVSAALRGAATRAEMLPIILDQLLALLKAEGATIAMRDPATGEIVLELGRGQWGGVTGTRIPAGQGISGDVIATGQAYVSGDALQDPRTYAGDRMGDLRAVACVPLIAQSRAIGALWVGRSATPHQEFSSAEVRLLTAIADMTATAIQRVTLYEQTATRLQRLDALRAIDLAITASLDLNLTLNVLLAQLTSQMGVHAADVLLLNPHTHLLEYAAGHGFHVAALKRRALRVGEGLAGRVALDRQALVAPDLAARLAELPAPTARHFQTEGFVTYGGLPLIAKGEVKGVLEIFHRSPLALDAEWLEFLNALAAQAAIAIDNAGLFSNLQRSNADLALAYDATIEGWSRALDLRDKETEGHTQRVTELTLKLARALRLSESELVHIRRGALLHDIGKMGVPDGILLKAGPLTDEEWVIMRQHPQFAYEMLAPIAYLRPALDIPYCHHEKWDGLGYPRGLREETIPLAARLFAVIDVWDALRSDRPYRQGWPEEKVREHIRSLAGKHFDPQAVEAFLRLEAGEC